MTVLSLNVWGGRRLEPLLAFLAHQAATVDVFCLQEMFSPTVPFQPATPGGVHDLTEQIQSVLPNHRHHFTVSRRQFGEGLSLLVRSRFAVLDQGSLELVHHAIPADRPSSRGATLQWARIAASQQRSTTVAHLHGYWEKDRGEDKPPRDEQVTSILDFVECQSDPIVLCGDFNMNRQTAGIARIGTRLRNLIEEDQIPTTRPPWNEYAGTIADYCFVSPELTVDRFAVLAEEVSDHLPLLVEVASL